MNEAEVPISRLVSNIVTVLAAVLVMSLAGLVALGLFDGDAGVRSTLTHIAETVVGVFIGIAAGRIAASEDA